jgi:PAS domain S-box-containing protein/putative nucleotidyltransferase with HDIG domain
MPTGVHTLADLVDLDRLQRVCDGLSAAGGLGMAVLDPAGTVLVAAGWQDICTRFHRVHEDTLRGCLESDARIGQRLRDGLDSPGHYAYRCSNGLWDVAFPLVIAGEHLGTVFTGQFFYDDDEIDEAAFCQRARRLGFDEATYLEALARVPRLSHEHVAQTIGFLGELVGMLADLGLSAIRLEQGRDAAGEGEALYRSILNASPDDISITDLEGRLRMASPAAVTMFGCAREEEMLDRLLTDFLVPEDRERAEGNVALMHQGVFTGPGDYRGLRADGSTFEIEANAEFIRDADEQPTGMVFVVRDITQRKRTEEALRQNQLRYETFINATDDMAFLKDDELRYVIVNEANAAYFGRSVEETIGRTDADLMTAEAAALCRISDIDAQRCSGVVLSHEEVDGRIYETRKFPVVLAEDRVGVGGYVRDITEGRLAEERLATVSRQWRQTFDAMTDSVALFDEEGRVLRCNVATTVLTGRGFDDIVGRHCFEVFDEAAGFRAGCPQLRALDSGRTETSAQEQDGRWLRVTFQPLTDEGGRVNGGVHVVTDVSELKHAEQGLLESLATQQTITEGVIAALARTVEVRDPYTAGHQRRVSELGAAIALHMGFDEERAEGVRVAGMLHDVGKITIPAEILSKPGLLTTMEFQLIKGHAQAGFEILETIHFPWVVAEMAQQHHERQDGSGYPEGLSGDEILPEARILAVADVVEAMASHRPYRAALGIEVALDEVRSGAGTRYEAAVVEACERVFAEGFAFTES